MEKARETLNEILLERRKIKEDIKIDRPLKIYIAGHYTLKEADIHDAARIIHENKVNAINMGIDVIDREGIKC